VSGSKTLPDLLREGLDLVFVGINPSEFSANAGHYFARPGNRFWPCFSASTLSLPARLKLGVQRLQPIHDRILPDCGIGFTDVVKNATPNISTLEDAMLVEGGRLLRDKFDHYRPRVACFQGMTGFRPFCRASGLPWGKSDLVLGLQPFCLGRVRLFLVPNPSGANAHASRPRQIQWYDQLAECLQRPGTDAPARHGRA
jgi:double-stranded uracil-DNA glycosylase